MEKDGKRRKNGIRQKTTKKDGKRQEKMEKCVCVCVYVCARV